MSCLGELVDGVELPGQVVQADLSPAPGASVGADAEQAQIVVVSGTGKPQERRVGARFTSDDLHPEHLHVEAHGTGEVGHEQHGPIDVGGLTAARYLEGMAYLNIALNARNDWSWRSGWKLVGPTS